MNQFNLIMKLDKPKMRLKNLIIINNVKIICDNS